MIPTDGIKARIQYCYDMAATMMDAEACRTTPKSALMHLRRTMDAYLAEARKLEDEYLLIESLNLGAK